MLVKVEWLWRTSLVIFLQQSSQKRHSYFTLQYTVACESLGSCATKSQKGNIVETLSRQRWRQVFFLFSVNVFLFCFCVYSLCLSVLFLRNWINSGKLLVLGRLLFNLKDYFIWSEFMNFIYLHYLVRRWLCVYVFYKLRSKW